MTATNRRRASLSLEALEDRTTPTVTATLTAGTLTINFSGKDDTAQIGSSLNPAGPLRVSGTGLPASFYTGVTAITVNDTSGQRGSQTLFIQDDNGAPQLTLSGLLSVDGVETVFFQNPTNTLAANSVSITRALQVRQGVGNTTPQISTDSLNIVASGVLGSPEAIGAAGNPLRVVGNAGSISANTAAGNKDQYFDLGGATNYLQQSVAANRIDAGTGTVFLTNGIFFGGSTDYYGDATTFNLGTGAGLGIASDTIGGLTGMGTVAAAFPGATTLTIGGGNVSSSFGGVIKNTDPNISSVGTAGPLAIVKTGTGTLTLTGANTYTGTTTISAGTLQIGAGGTIGTLGTGGVTNNAALVFNRSNSATIPNAISGSGSVLYTGTGITSTTYTLSGANAYAGTTTVAGATVVLGAAGAYPTGSNLVLGNAANAPGVLRLNGRDASVGSLSSIGTGTSQVTNFGGTGTNTLTVTQSDATTFVGILGGSSGNDNNLALVKAGTGTLTLGNANSTFTGNVTVNGGTLAANASANGLNPTTSALGNPQTANRTITVNAGATLSFGRTDVLGFNSSTPVVGIVANGGTVTNSGNVANALGPLTLNGGTLSAVGGLSPTFRTWNLRGGSVTVGGTAASTISATGPNAGVHLSANTTFTVNDATGNANPDLIVSALLDDQSENQSNAPGGFTKTGAGTMLLSGANEYTGGTTVVNGTLLFTTAGALGTGAVGVGTATTPGGAMPSLLATFGTAGTVPNALTAGAAGATIGSFPSSVEQPTFAGTLTLAAPVTLTGGATNGTVFSGRITGTGNVTVARSPVTAGAVVLNNLTANLNDFAGNVTVGTNAVLQLGFGGLSEQISDASVVTLSTGSTLAFLSTGGAVSERIGGLVSAAGAGSVQVAGGTATLTVGTANAADAFDYGGTTSEFGAGATLFVVMAGQNTQTFSGNLAIGGTLNVNGGGRVLLNGTMADGASNPDVVVTGTGSTLGGNGTIAGTVQVRSGGRLRPGTTTANQTLTTGGESFQPTPSELGIKVRTAAGALTADQLKVTGTVNLTGATLFVVPLSNALPGGTSITIVDNDGADPITGTFAGLAEGATFTGQGGTQLYRVSYTGGTGNDVTITVVPPPDTTPPTAALGSAPGVTAAGSSPYQFTVAYSDNVAVNAGTLDGNDIQVTGPNGFSVLAGFVSSAGANPLTGTYQFTPRAAPGTAATTGRTRSRSG